MKISSLKTLIIFLGASAIIGFVIVWFGIFNIAATDKHWDITTNLLEIVRDRSIVSNADDVQVPNLDDKTRIAKGAPNYAAMCAQCHLAPGIKTSELYEGLYPQPPVLYKHGLEEQLPAETFWVIKNGLKMTGMPSWGIYNSDDQIWDMIAFIKALKNISADEYQKMIKEGEHSHAKGGHDATTKPEHHKKTETKSKVSHSDDHGGSQPH